MGGLIPLSDASRRPVHFPIVTTCIILTNFFVFALELMGGDAFVLRWAAVAANITAGHDWITILTAIFLHGSWSHIIGNVIFLWVFGPEIEDSMNPLRYLAFYIVGGLVAMLAQVAVSPGSTVPNLGATGAMWPRTIVRTGLRRIRPVSRRLELRNGIQPFECRGECIR